MLKILKRFFDFCDKTNRNKFYKSLGHGILQALFDALKIPAIAVILQAVLENNITTKSIILSLVLMLVSVLGQGLVRYRSTMLQTEGGYGSCADKRIEIAEHLRYLPMGYFNTNSLGYITSVTTNTMETLSDIATRVIMMVTTGVLSTILITLMIFFFDWRIALIICAGLAVYFAVNTMLQHYSNALSVEKTRSDSALVEKVLEYIKGISEVKSYHLVGKFAKKLDIAIEDNVKINTEMEVKLTPFTFLQNVVSKLISVAVAISAICFYCTDTMSLLNCTIMVICAFLITNSLDSAGMYSPLLKVVDLSVQKAQAILDLAPMDIDGEDIKPESYDIVAKNIDFSYDKKKIIDDVSLTIPQNTKTAIIGPSGGGKTTLCHLLSRFWDVDSGEVTLGGRNVKEYSMDSLMKNFSFVFQNVTLFHDTVANNIRFGHPEASMDKVIEAAKKARSHDFIMQLPNGYETVIGEDGSSLSGGERQRLSIARAIMKDSPIIILDEATANVDPENEEDLMNAIEELTHNKTIIMIAHRLKTVKNSDNIIVVDKGKIVQQGTHDELISEDGIYKDFIDVKKAAVSWKIS